MVSAIQREEPVVPQRTEEFITKWCERIKSAKAHHDKAFRRMREDQEFALGNQWRSDEGKLYGLDADEFVANITAQHLDRRTASLYAKNPTVVARRRNRLDFAVWDENPQTLAQAVQALAADPFNAQAAAIVQDAQQGLQRRVALKRMGRTLEILFEHQMDEQSFDQRMKQFVRRAHTTGVAWLKLGYRRQMELSPDQERERTSLADRLGHMEALAADIADREKDTQDAEAEELRIAIERLQSDAAFVSYEGLKFDFPKSTAIIPDTKCRRLRGLEGAEWVAEEHVLSKEQVKALFKVDVGEEFNRYGHAEERDTAPDPERDGNRLSDRGLVWEVYDRKTHSVFVIMDGWPDFLQKPKAPDLKFERFFPYFLYAPNEVEHFREIWPPSDVRRLRHVQVEVNRRINDEIEHRKANAPRYVTVAGKFTDDEQPDGTQVFELNLPAHSVIPLKGLGEGDDVRRVLQRIPVEPINPNDYEIGSMVRVAELVQGAQEALLGGVSNATATETSLSASATATTESSKVADIDQVLTEVARSAGQILFTWMQPDTVRRIVGPGAVWPERDPDEIAGEVLLEIEAGSSGKPNQAQEIANFERMAPLLLQLPGVNPVALVKEGFRRLDDRLQITDILAPNLPSIVALNGQARPQTGDAASEPTQQGPRGADRPPSGPGQEPTAVPSGNSAAVTNGGLLP